MVKTEAPACAKAAGNSYSLHLPLGAPLLDSTCRLSVGLLIRNLRAPVESEPECRSACAIPNRRCWQQQSPAAAVPLSAVTASPG